MEAPEGRRRVGDLAEAVGLRQPTVSYHLRLLLEDGVVTRQQEGRSAWFAVAPERENELRAVLGGEGSGGAPDLDRIVADLTTRFRGTFGPETIDAYVRESLAMLSRGGAVPRQLASRTAAFASERLEALARAGSTAHEKPEVLFVCVQNAGRSQIASAILRHLAGDRVVVRSAGSMPALELRSTIATALDEIGVPQGSEFPKPLTDEAVRAADVVITMGCGDACPIHPGRRYLDWELEDPKGLPLERVRPIRDEIERRVRELLDELLD